MHAGTSGSRTCSIPRNLAGSWVDEDLPQSYFVRPRLTTDHDHHKIDHRHKPSTWSPTSTTRVISSPMSAQPFNTASDWTTPPMPQRRDSQLCPSMHNSLSRLPMFRRSPICRFRAEAVVVEGASLANNIRDEICDARFPRRHGERGLAPRPNSHDPARTTPGRLVTHTAPDNRSSACVVAKSTEDTPGTTWPGI